MADPADEAQTVEALEGEAVCRDCDQVIPAARLAAVPEACRCVLCQADRDEED